MDSDAIRKLLAEATPGPWQLEELCTVLENGDEELDGVEVTAGRFHVHDHDLGYDNGPVGAKIYANARLIAAAPDLAAEVLRLRSLIGRYINHVGDEEGTNFLSYRGLKTAWITDAEAAELGALEDAAALKEADNA